MKNQITQNDDVYQINISELTARTPQATDLVIVQETGNNDITKATVSDIGSVVTSGLATVATTGDYTDLSNKPSLATVATSGQYSDLSNKPSLAAVATSGSYNDLSNTPSLATVATTGSYNDLSNKPNILPIDGTTTDDTVNTGILTWSLAASDTAKYMKVSDLAGTLTTFTVDCTNGVKHTSHNILIENDTASDVTVTFIMTGAAEYTYTGDTNGTFIIAAYKFVEMNAFVYDNFPSVIIKEY